MVLWPVVALVGFLLLTALVIALGTTSTARYEQERQAVATPRATVAPEPVPAAA